MLGGDWAVTLLRYILTSLSLRRVSTLSLTSFLSWSRCCAKSLEGACLGSGTGPENLSLPDLVSFLFTSTLRTVMSGGLSTAFWESDETCRPPASESSSTQSRLATEEGEVKERLDLFSLSLREELSFWWGCREEEMMHYQMILIYVSVHMFSTITHKGCIVSSSIKGWHTGVVVSNIAPSQRAGFRFESLAALALFALRGRAKPDRGLGNFHRCLCECRIF